MAGFPTRGKSLGSGFGVRGGPSRLEERGAQGPQHSPLDPRLPAAGPAWVGTSRLDSRHLQMATCFLFPVPPENLDDFPHPFMKKKKKDRKGNANGLE